ncbi:unnamed protein product [Rotaria sp. Silwood2]|nr:unnamed protein product [Rotaria sp. Silwood2]CAF4463011.1 unnamed protein product [Rotaria sp. Silwood2]
MFIKEFYDIDDCITWIQSENSRTIFLIILTNELDDCISYIAEFDAINALYIITDAEYQQKMQTKPTYLKFSGTICNYENLFEKLTTDICFYRQSRIHLLTMNIFKIDSHILDKLSKDQIDIIRFHFFTDILPQLSIQLKSTSFDSDKISIDSLPSYLMELNRTIKNLFKQSDSFKFEESIQSLKIISQFITSLSEQVKSSTFTVYRCQLMSKADLKLMQTNNNILLSPQSFILASRSIHSILNLCCRAVDNRLSVILFEIKLSEKTPVVYLDSDLILLNLGILFRLVSIDLRPDGIFHAQLELANAVIEHIKEQIQCKLSARLTWLTFGNYLMVLKDNKIAEEYYRCLLNMISPDHPSLVSIYNNMGLMYMTMKKNQQALEYLEKVSTFPSQSTLNVTEPNDSSMSIIRFSHETAADRSSTLNKIAEVSYHLGDYSTALDCYQQLFDMEDDKNLREFYRSKIEFLSCFCHKY